MKYKVKLLTPRGPVTEIYDATAEDLETFRQRMITKYETFITLQSNQI